MKMKCKEILFALMFCFGLSVHAMARGRDTLFTPIEYDDDIRILGIMRLTPDLHIGPVSVKIPLMSMSTIYMFDFVDDAHFLGAETLIATLGPLNTTFGAAIKTTGEGTPFIGVDLMFPESFLGGILHMGAGLLYNFNETNMQAGIKASILLY